MKTFFITILLMIGSQSFADNSQKKNVGSPPNAVSRGQAENSGISESPSGVTPEEARQNRSRAESMGGAPNAGAGMATGTGAGSTIGGDDGDVGTLTAGAASGETDE